MNSETQPSVAGPAEIVSTRTIAAPRERVYRAFSDAAQLARWWGPAGFTNTFEEFNLRAGGRWRFEMHGPDGARYRQERRFVEVVPPERIVCENVDPVHRFRMMMTFEPHPVGTCLTWRMSFESTDEFARVRDVIAAANEENFDRLERLLRDGH